MRHFLHEGQILFTDCKKSKMATVLIEDDNRLKKRHKTIGDVATTLSTSLVHVLRGSETSW